MSKSLSLVHQNKHFVVSRRQVTPTGLGPLEGNKLTCSSEGKVWCKHVCLVCLDNIIELTILLEQNEFLNEF